MKEIDTTSNPRIYKLLKRERDTSCSYCKPNRGENIKRKSLAGKKYKIKKRFQLRRKLLTNKTWSASIESRRSN